jgi:hypothetical protein
MNQPTHSAPTPSVEPRPAQRAPNTDGIWYNSYPPNELRGAFVEELHDRLVLPHVNFASVSRM